MTEKVGPGTGHGIGKERWKTRSYRCCFNFRAPGVQCKTTFRPWAGAARLQPAARPRPTGPSSNGRTADFGSVNGGSNPPGPIGLTKFCSSLLLQVAHEPE